MTQHVWASRVPNLDAPDVCVFDLDPSGDDAAAVRAAALDVHALLAELSLMSWIKATGSKGFHIVVPLDGAMSMGQAAPSIRVRTRGRTGRCSQRAQS